VDLCEFEASLFYVGRQITGIKAGIWLGCAFGTGLKTGSPVCTLDCGALVRVRRAW